MMVATKGCNEDFLVVFTVNIPSDGIMGQFDFPLDLILGVLTPSLRSQTLGFDFTQ